MASAAAMRWVMVIPWLRESESREGRKEGEVYVCEMMAEPRVEREVVRIEGR